MFLNTVNIGRGESSESAKSNMLAALARHGIVGWQEIDEADAPDEHGILQSLLPKGAGTAGWSSLQPITTSARYHVVRERQAKGCPGLAKYTPMRMFSIAHVTIADRPELGEFAVINFHAPINRLATKPLRLLMRRRLKALIRKELAAGRTVFWTADTNDGRYPQMHPDEQVLAHRGLDWIRGIEAPGGIRWSLVAQGTSDLTIDGHDAVWVQVSLHRPVKGAKK